MPEGTIHMRHAFVEFMEVLWRRGGQRGRDFGKFDPQNLAEVTVGHPLVRVSVLTRYSGHLFSRLSRGVPNMYKQTAPPPT